MPTYLEIKELEKQLKKSGKSEVEIKDEIDRLKAKEAYVYNNIE